MSMGLKSGVRETINFEYSESNTSLQSYLSKAGISGYLSFTLGINGGNTTVGRRKRENKTQKWEHFHPIRIFMECRGKRFFKQYTRVFLYATDFSVSLKLLDFSFVSVSKLLSSSLLNFAFAEPEIASFLNTTTNCRRFYIEEFKNLIAVCITCRKWKQNRLASFWSLYFIFLWHFPYGMTMGNGFIHRFPWNFRLSNFLIFGDFEPC